MRKRFLLALICILPGILQAQTDEKKFGIKFSGFVKSDFFVDSRQTVNAREGHFLLWPAAPSFDAQGKDINSKGSTTFLAVQSRLSVKITGPDALGAQTSGLIEGDFFGQANDNINLLRLRHAFVKMNWATTELLFGQTWNPLFVTSCFPGTVSFNTGTPIQLFARHPQIRLTQNFGKFSAIFAASEQRDYASTGPIGVSNSYLKNSVIPDLHAQLHYQSKSENGNTVAAGIGMEAKTLVPRLSSVTDGKNYQVDESVFSKVVLGFFTAANKQLTFKVYGAYTENISELPSMSGYAVKDIRNSSTGELSYTPLTNAQAWAEVHTNGTNWQFGIFAGANKALGTKEAMSSPNNTIYGSGTDIKMLYRVSPRIIRNIGKLRFAGELEYTAAEFGKKENGVITRDHHALPTQGEWVNNLRTLFSVYYFF